MRKRRVLLVIYDGFGIGKPYKGNAIFLAKTPNFDKLWHSRPRAILEASGEAVGLPEGQMGTSEVNHLTIGAGRVIFQDLVKINKDIESQRFFNNEAFIKVFEHVKKHNSVLHIKGLISKGGVHSHQDHVYALIKAAKLYGIEKIYIHVFTDGRDTLPKSAIKYVRELEEFLKQMGVGKIASISGRYYAMDRDNNWDRVGKAFEVLTKGSKKKYKSAIEAIEDFYKKGITDEFIEPVNIEVGPGEEGTISSNDGVIFINFRTDRARELTELFLKKGPKNLSYATMTRYRPDFDVHIAYPPEDIKNTLGEVLSNQGLKQLRITETEKFAHVTFFFNAKREEAFEGEDRIMLDSYSDIKTHDERPEMRTHDIVNGIIQDMEHHNHEFILTNVCNLDMVGHSGKLEPTIKAAEVVDWSIGELVKASLKYNYDLIITADHGNAEELIDEETGEPLTSHTTNPVPFIIVSESISELNTDHASLIDIAPTVLDILGIDKPKEMTGKSLIS